MGTDKTGALNARGWEKVTISDQYLAIARKRLKIDGYILPCVWPALNPLSIHVKFTAVVLGAFRRGGQHVQKCAKMANFWTYELNYWETVKDRWVHAAMRLTSIDLFIHVTFTATVPGRTQGRPKGALGWLQKLTHAPLATAILLVALHTKMSLFFHLALQWPSTNIQAQNTMHGFLLVDSFIITLFIL